METKLLYVIRNNYTDENKRKQTSILGVFDTFPKAYHAAHKKALQLKDSHPRHKMQLKTVALNVSDYNGCSAYEFNFLEEKSELQLTLMQGVIERWWGWKDVYNVDIKDKISLRESIIKGFSGDVITIYLDQQCRVIDGKLFVEDKEADEKDCEHIAYHIFDFESSAFGNKCKD